jgi:hypothetical protein
VDRVCADLEKEHANFLGLYNMSDIYFTFDLTFSSKGSAKAQPDLLELFSDFSNTTTAADIFHAPRCVTCFVVFAFSTNLQKDSGYFSCARHMFCRLYNFVAI